MSLTNLQPVTQRSSAVLSKPQSANQTQTTEISSTKSQSSETSETLQTLQTPKCPKCGCVSYRTHLISIHGISSLAEV
jgi:hypothetical protein